MKITYAFCFFLFSFASFAQEAQKKFVPFNHKSMMYEGRIGLSDTCASFYWSGSNVSIHVKGTDTLKAIISDSRANNFYYVIVDGDSSNAKKLRIGKEKKAYNLAWFTDHEKHHVQLYKITNTDDHITNFFGFEVSAKAKVFKRSRKPKRTIEFFGNSITCGHGVDVPIDSADSGKPEYFNNYRAYAATTARHFKAQFHCTAKSGIGITISWFNQIMPEIYDRLNPNDSTSKWDFKKYSPDIVVVNLFQNDSWLTTQTTHPQFKARFGTEKPTEEFIINAYANFIRTIRNKYPNAQIICCLGNMDATKAGSKWPGYIESAVGLLNDNKIATHFFVYKNTPGHPRISEQAAMAKSLIEFIKSKQYWKN